MYTASESRIEVFGVIENGALAAGGESRNRPTLEKAIFVSSHVKDFSEKEPPVYDAKIQARKPFGRCVDAIVFF